MKFCMFALSFDIPQQSFVLGALKHRIVAGALKHRIAAGALKHHSWSQTL